MCYFPSNTYRIIITYVQKRLEAWWYLRDGPNIIQKGFNQVGRVATLQGSLLICAVEWKPFRGPRPRRTVHFCFLCETYSRA